MLVSLGRLLLASGVERFDPFAHMTLTSGGT